MILDKIENAALYYSLSESFKEAFKYVENTDFNSLKDGVYDVAEGIFAIVSRYQTKEKELAKLESHRKYIDLQFMYSGEEYFGYSALAEQKVSDPYDDKKDLMFYDAAMEYCKLEEKSFAVFFPTDLHAPGILSDTKKEVLKVVVKIAV